jgi:fumarate hydratase subunit beta
MIDLKPPLEDKQILELHAGDRVRLQGTIYVARDAAHKRLTAALAENRPLPFAPRGQVIYYMGPSPARPGEPIGSAGPTTSVRMDGYTEAMLRAGVKALVGKGERGPAVRQALQRYKALYLVAIGGAGALLAQSIRAAEVVAYPELGPEAVRKLTVVDFPAIVGCDSYGQDVYITGREPYRGR